MSNAVKRTDSPTPQTGVNGPGRPDFRGSPIYWVQVAVSRPGRPFRRPVGVHHHELRSGPGGPLNRPLSGRWAVREPGAGRCNGRPERMTPRSPGTLWGLTMLPSRPLRRDLPRFRCPPA